MVSLVIDLFVNFLLQTGIMRKLLPVILLLVITLNTSSQQITTRFEQSGFTQSPPYQEIIDWWKKLDQRFPQVSMLTMGPSDAGFPLHLVIVSNDKDFDF